MPRKFEDTIMATKGDYAEALVDRLVHDQGLYHVYPIKTEGPHPVDRLLIRRDSFNIIAMDVKAVSARYSKPEFVGKGCPDTGISIAHRDVYQQIVKQHKIPLYLMFVDEVLGEVYGNWLSVLERPTTIQWRNKTLNYPLVKDNFTAVGKQIVYYPLESMERDLYHLTDDEKAELHRLSNYMYKQDISHKHGYDEWKDSKNDY